MKKILMVLLLIFIFIQFFQIDKTNPPVNQDVDFLNIKKTPPQIASIIKTSCYDCHSNETVYPWYANIQPFGWFLQHHIEDARKHLNFSTFATYETKRQAHKMEESAEEVEKGGMPLESYLLMHKEARLSEAQKKELVDYFKTVEQNTKATMSNSNQNTNSENPQTESESKETEPDKE